VGGSLIDLSFFFTRYLSATSVSDRDNITWAGQVIKKKNSFLIRKTINNSFLDSRW
jgi:hypothetical protein